jgi:hypothetical protein
MSQNDAIDKIPNLIVLVTLLVIDYWIVMTHASTLIGAGDYGPLVGIPLIVAIVLAIVIVIGLKSICDNTYTYKQMTTISLILFVIEMLLIFLEYALIAVGVAD